MPLSFEDPVGRYDQQSDCIHFLGRDNDRDVRFAVSRNALEDLEGAGELLDEAGLQRSYMSNIDTVRRVARTVYAAGLQLRQNTYLITSDHLGNI